MNLQEVRTGPRSGLRKLLGSLALTLLAACGGNQFAYFDDGGGLTLTIVREQSYLGGAWNTTLVSAAASRCAQRHPLPEFTDSAFQMHVFRPEPGIYILKSGTKWYVTELQTCKFQAYRTPPPYPGDMVGRFEARNGRIDFFAEKAAKR